MSAWGPQRAFCATVEQGNFSAAAKALGVTPQAISRAVARLEEQLGVALFERTTRHVHPTTAGRTYYEACKHALEGVDEAAAHIQRAPEQLMGKLRVVAHPSYARARLMPCLASFCARHPRVQVTLERCAAGAAFDLKIDQTPSDSSEFLGRLTMGVFGSPDGSAKRPALGHPDDLRQQVVGALLEPEGDDTTPWRFASGETRAPEASVRFEDDILLLEWAAAGGGVVQAPHALAAAYVGAGTLVEVLSDHPLQPRTFHAHFLRPTLAAQALVRALVEQS